MQHYLASSPLIIMEISTVNETHNTLNKCILYTSAFLFKTIQTLKDNSPSCGIYP